MSKRASPNNPLSPKERIFVENLLATAQQGKSAEVAGYASPDQAGNNLMGRPHVAAAIAEGRKAVQEKLSYGLEKAMEQAQQMLDFAVQTENANAGVKAVELMAKLNGLLIERVDLRAQSGFHVNIIRRARALPDIPLVKSEEDDDDIWS